MPSGEGIAAQVLFGGDAVSPEVLVALADRLGWDEPLRRGASIAARMDDCRGVFPNKTTSVRQVVVEEPAYRIISHVGCTQTTMTRGLIQIGTQRHTYAPLATQRLSRIPISFRCKQDPRPQNRSRPSSTLS